MEEATVPSVFDEMQNEQPFEYATTGERFANYIIDIAVYYALNYCISFVLFLCIAYVGGDVRAMASNLFLLYLIAFINLVIIYTLIEGITKGRSLGKLITRTQAVKEDLSPISWKDALIRSLSRIIPFEPFSGFGGNPWHDQFSKTHVIKKMQKI